jgi:cytoplasmic iron level regulating protein YaaA (DUF328/UPF0246 family)
VTGRLTILLPPSEGKTPGGRESRPWSVDSGRFGALAEPRARVARALARARGGDGKLLGATGELLDAARAANQCVVGGATLPAWQRFTGVVWQHLDPEGLGREAQRRARSSVIVVSAVTGLSGWSDPTPDFRLKLSVNLSPLGRLDAFWRAPLSTVLNRRLRGQTVIDLLPNEHRAAWVCDPTRYRLLRPQLLTRDGRPGGHDAKATKGRLARALLLDDDPDRALRRFDAGSLVLSIDEPTTPEFPP